MLSKSTRYCIYTFIVLSIALVSCTPYPTSRRVRTESEIVEVKDADSVQTDILMGAGELEINGGAGELLEANFRYSDRDLVPDISYRVRNNGVGSLKIEQEEKTGSNLRSDYHNLWDLTFNSEIPLDLVLIMGAGKSNLDLEELNLKSFTMQMGVGQAYLDLGKVPAEDLDLDIQGGVGELTVILPADANIEARVTGGLGEVNTAGLNQQNGVYVSDYEGPGPVIRIRIEAGIGELNLFVQ